MKNLKTILLLSCILAGSAWTNAQSSLTLDASQLLASFKFVDTQGGALNKEYQGVFTGAYGIGFRYVAESGFMVKTGIGLRNGGASLVYDNMNYSWKLQYADARLGFGYSLKLNRFCPYFVASGYFGYLLRGTQVLNNEEFNITDSGLLSTMDYGVIFSPGISIKLSDYVSSYVEFSYLMGLNNIEEDDGQNAKNFAYGLTLGLSFTISKN